MSYRKIRPPNRRRIIAPTRDWPNQGILPISDMPSAAGTVIDKGILPQLLRQGLGSMGSVHNVEHFAQNFPRLKKIREDAATRLENVRENVKSKVSQLRARSLAADSLTDPQPWGRGQIIQPTPYGPRRWPLTAGVGDMPSVASVIAGPARSMFPMLGRLSSAPEDGRPISIHTDMDNLVSEANLATGISVQVE